MIVERPQKAFGAAVAFGQTHEGGPGRDAGESVLALEVIADELAAGIVPKLESSSDTGGYRLKYLLTPWRIGLSASNRVLRFAVWVPIHSAVACSMVSDTTTMLSYSFLTPWPRSQEIGVVSQSQRAVLLRANARDV